MTLWLLVRGRGSQPLDATIRAEEIRAHSSSKRPSVEPGDLAILYAAVWQALYGVVEIDVIEVNEAFASVVSQFLADTGLQERYEAGDVNPNGGGISLGHPLGATGARITATLLNELERRDARYGIATMCIGFGQALAGVVERL